MVLGASVCAVISSTVGWSRKTMAVWPHESVHLKAIKLSTRTGIMLSSVARPAHALTALVENVAQEKK